MVVVQEEAAHALVEAMVEGNALELLVQRLSSLDESSDAEAAAVYAALSIFENMIELKPEVSEQAVEKTQVHSCQPCNHTFSMYSVHIYHAVRFTGHQMANICTLLVCQPQVAGGLLRMTLRCDESCRLQCSAVYLVSLLASVTAYRTAYRTLLDKLHMDLWGAAAELDPGQSETEGSPSGQQQAVYVRAAGHFDAALREEPGCPGSFGRH